ncbi:oxygen-independent coproporphyrinogen-3 oxidase [Thermosyntropha lipolytica DSM 11003]|uniref:Oxygen-independent coproporphyrinogen-3 oxidase n=1 Tax=Thermosyntropha lipolytica DSM 11003 TaxID=1123382 RepID=A0A1M5P1T0_9FIRM|nr:coproporphyrinogen dehydrogenase HemZ [Thermosyntropha lipolytica]SHG95143.1 oxygen-independent coproporphyrinogen-3 oxidase [Thermosyntropha lipolytica DSM 11003]
MFIYMELAPENLYDYMHELVRMGYPDARVTMKFCPEAEVVIRIKSEEKKGGLFFTGEIEEGEKKTDFSHFYPLKSEDGHNEMHKIARIFIFELLFRHLGKKVNAYGILTGVRPVKLVHRLLDLNYDREKIESILKDEYLLTDDKAKILVEVACRNRPYLLTREEAYKLVSLYIGIPFCPTRCYYCSFPGAVLKDYALEIPPFMQALKYEIEGIGNFLRSQNIKVQTIYIGGGTPTVLSESDLENLFIVLHDNFILDNIAEITVEAGRPDTLTRSKLKILQGAGVNRVCINPQSMCDATLRAIGRNHDVKGVIQAYNDARAIGITNINMDVIIGLPGENLRQNMHTAREILSLEPENVTVHTLAVKRGAKMAEEGRKGTDAARIAEVSQGVAYFWETLTGAGYVPYYLYRQKYMQASMENTGFSKPGRFCLYNIQMIEERQTIIGLGGGAASKFVNPADWTLSSLYNPKNPQAYCDGVFALVNRKVDKLKCLN